MTKAASVTLRSPFGNLISLPLSFVCKLPSSKRILSFSHVRPIPSVLPWQNCQRILLPFKAALLVSHANFNYREADRTCSHKTNTITPSYWSNSVYFHPKIPSGTWSEEGGSVERTLDLLSEELPLTGCETMGRLFCFSEPPFPQFLRQRFTENMWDLASRPQSGWNKWL